MKKILKAMLPVALLPYLRLFNNVFVRKDAVSLKSVEFFKNKPNLVVLGNGPSMDEDVGRLLDARADHDFFCVNNFAVSDLYEKFKPNKYLFMDDYFFSDESHLDWKLQREKTFSYINEKTRWPLQVFVPAQADVEIIKKSITNTNIEFVKFCSTGYFSENLKYSFNLFDTGLFGPFQGNVLIYAIYLGIWSKYDRVKVFGADLSLHENVRVDQQTNDLYIEFKHFNNSVKRERFMKNPGKVEPFCMHEFMKLMAETFSAHNVLQDYAKSKGVEITNCSSYSLIDAYPRG